jgi:hypothetical protein
MSQPFSAKLETAIDVLQKKADSLENRINERIFRLYDLNQEEQETVDLA